MGIKSGFFDAMDLGGGEYDRIYDAADFAHYFALLVGNGVFPTPDTGLHVTSVTPESMQLKVTEGSGWINGYYITVEDSESVTIPPADSANPRIDSVLLQWSNTDRDISIVVRSGTANANPQPITLQRDAEIWELELAQVRVEAGVSSIGQTKITDKRGDNNRCGIVTQLVKSIDVSTFLEQSEAEFNEWFNNLKEVVGDDPIGQFLVEIQTVKDELADKVQHYNKPYYAKSGDTADAGYRFTTTDDASSNVTNTGITGTASDLELQAGSQKFSWLNVMALLGVGWFGKSNLTNRFSSQPNLKQAVIPRVISEDSNTIFKPVEFLSFNDMPSTDYHDGEPIIYGNLLYQLYISGNVGSPQYRVYLMRVGNSTAYARVDTGLTSPSGLAPIADVISNYNYELGVRIRNSGSGSNNMYYYKISNATGAAKLTKALVIDNISFTDFTVTSKGAYAHSSATSVYFIPRSSWSTTPVDETSFTKITLSGIEDDAKVLIPSSDDIALIRYPKSNGNVIARVRNATVVSTITTGSTYFYTDSLYKGYLVGVSMKNSLQVNLRGINVKSGAEKNIALDIGQLLWRYTSNNSNDWTCDILSIDPKYVYVKIYNTTISYILLVEADFNSSSILSIVRTSTELGDKFVAYDTSNKLFRIRSTATVSKVGSIVTAFEEV